MNYLENQRALKQSVNVVIISNSLQKASLEQFLEATLAASSRMSRPRSLRSLYIALAFVGVLALYWFSGLENNDISHTFKQPEILVDYHGRGKKFK